MKAPPRNANAPAGDQGGCGIKNSENNLASSGNNVKPGRPSQDPRAKGMIAFEGHSGAARAIAVRLGVHDKLAAFVEKKAKEGPVIAVASKADGAQYFIVLYSAGFPQKKENGWSVLMAPNSLAFRAIAMAAATFATAGTIHFVEEAH